MLTQYASTPGNARSPVTLETFTTDAAVERARACGVAARINRNGARRLMSSISSHAASVVFSTVPVAMMPAALTSVVSPPNARDGRGDDRVRRVRGGHVGLERHAPAARPLDLLSHLVQRRRLTADGQHGGAVAPETRRAAARPMPLDAPVTTTICIGCVVAQLEQLSLVSDSRQTAAR